MDEALKETLSEEELKKIRQHFFKESIKLENMRLEIEEEKEKLNKEKIEFERLMEAKESVYQLSKNQLLREKRSFDQQLSVLKMELKKLAAEKEQLKKDKAALESMKNKYSYFTTNENTTVQSIFFKGLKTEGQRKKRYKDLSRIFHPDNMNGDDEMMKMINLEYDNIKH